MNYKQLIKRIFNTTTALSCSLFLLTSQNSLADLLPKSNPVQGGIAVINLNIPTAEKMPVAKFNKKRVMVKGKNKSWHAVVGISLNTKPGKYFVKTTSEKYPFLVRNKKYKTQHLTIKNKRKVNPTKKDIMLICFHTFHFSLPIHL